MLVPVIKVGCPSFLYKPCVGDWLAPNKREQKVDRAIEKYEDRKDYEMHGLIIPYHGTIWP